MAFEGLSEKLNATFKRLRGKGRISEADVKNLEIQTGFLTVLQFGDPAVSEPMLELSLTNSGILIYRHSSGVYFRSNEGAVNTRRVHQLLGW